MIRLNKFLSQAGVASRREADRWILEGRVKVNGSIIKVLGHKICDQSDDVEVDGKHIKKTTQHMYLMLNKPKGVLVTLKDPQNRPTVKNLIGPVRQRVFPVGRLDLNSEGLLLLMDDGELAYRLMHPRYQVDKEYQVRVKGLPEESSLERLRKGIYLDGRKTAPARVVMLTAGAKKCLLNIGIHEGRKREVRRMVEAIGHTPIALKRVRFAGLTLGGLKPGQWRHLTSDEVAQLKKQVNLD
jgi:pseudouridine synthase